MEKQDYIWLCLLALVVAVLPLAIRNDYYIGVCVFAALNCLACIGLSLLMGYAGQISLCHAAFIAIGAYSSAILTVKAGWSPWTAMGAGVGFTIIIALFVGVPSLRLKGHYLAMATLGFGSILHIVSVAAVPLTGGPEGINNIPHLNLFGLKLNTDKHWFYFGWSMAILGLYFALNLIHSRIGRGLRAIHGSEDAACSLGVNTAASKILVFIISAVYSSVAGSFYAYYVRYIDPGPFDIMHSILLVTMVAVGGMHTIWGAVIGSTILTLLPTFLSYVSEYFKEIGFEYTPDYDILLYGGILLSIMLFLPDGLLDGINRLKNRLGRYVIYHKNNLMLDKTNISG